MAHRNINKAGLDLIKASESFVAYVYDDFVVVKGKYPLWKPSSAVKGTLTIGYGHTDTAKYKMGVLLKDYKGPDWTEKKGAEVLDVDLDECEDAVSRIVKVKLNDNQFAALVSFTYNCGEGNLTKICNKLNAGDYDDVPGRLMQYTKSKGKELRGLVIRRRAEAALWRSLPEEAKASAEQAAPHAIPDQVDQPASTTTDWAGTVAGGGTALQAVASATSAAKEVKENTGEFNLFGTLDHLVARPSFWIAVAFGCFVMWWTRWPSWFWRRFATPPKDAQP